MPQSTMLEEPLALASITPGSGAPPRPATPRSHGKRELNEKPQLPAGVFVGPSSMEHVSVKSQRATFAFKAIMGTMTALALIVFIMGIWKLANAANTQAASAQSAPMCAQDGTCYRIRKKPQLVKPTA